MRMLVNGFAYAYKYSKEAETERTGSPYILLFQKGKRNICITGKVALLFFLWMWNKTDRHDLYKFK